MTQQQQAFLHLDDPSELADVAREMPRRETDPLRLEAVLAIDGVHCAACVVAIEAALRDAVDEVSVSAASRRARIVWRPDRYRLSELLSRIAALGYSPRPVSRLATQGIEAAGRRKALWRMLVAVLCMMQVMMYAWPRYVAGSGEMAGDIVALLVWAEWMLALPVLAFAAGPFFASAWRDLRHRRIGMDVPVSLGIVVTFVASSAAAVAGEEVYFDSLTMFVAFLLIARWLEAAARERALMGVTDLLSRLPETIQRIDPNGSVAAITARQLRPGDRIRIPAGQSVPADGTVESGSSHADESLLTGESRPQSKRAGDAVVAGSMNLTGPLVVRVERTARDSRLQQIADLIDQASTRKPRLAQLADRWAGPFLVGILLLSVAAWFGWQWIDPQRSIWVAASLLIITCPCALSLATPAALLAASGRLAAIGVLVRSPQAIESLAQADTFAFDKTGTLTLDRITVAAVHTNGIDRQTALAAAAALDAGSLHSAAAALRDAAGSMPLPPVRDVVEVAGAGVSGKVALAGVWRDARLGSPCHAGDESADDGAGHVWLNLDGRPVARFALAETLRADAARAIGHLRKDGIRLLILSGDSERRVAGIAGTLAIEDARARAAPQDKLAAIVALQQSGRKVAMIGDGINDAPVLARANVSVAFATGAALAQHQADFLLLGGRLDSLVQARLLARRAMQVVRQNLAFSMLYNAVCIPLALIGWVPPWLAGLGMAASSVVVVANALRIAGGPKPAPYATDSADATNADAAIRAGAADTLASFPGSPPAALQPASRT